MNHLNWLLVIVTFLSIVFCLSGSTMLESTSESDIQVGTFMLITGIVIYITAWTFVLISKGRSLWYLFLLPTHGIGIIVLLLLENKREHKLMNPLDDPLDELNNLENRKETMEKLEKLNTLYNRR